MEPFKALVLLAAAAIVSFVTAGAVGFYAGYSAGRGNLEEIKAHISGAQAVIPSGDGGVVSLKPVLDDVRALSKQVEALATVKASAAADNDSSTKLVLDEIKGLSGQIDVLRQDSFKPSPAPAAAVDRASSTPPAPDYTDALQDIRDQVRALNAKAEKQEPKAPKALQDEFRALSASIQAQEPNLRRIIGDELRSAVAEPKAPKALMDEILSLITAIQTQEANLRRALGDEVRSALAASQAMEPKAESKAPKGLMDEMRSLNVSIQAQEPNMRRIIGEEVRSAVANSQNAEPKAPKAIVEELKSLSSSIQSQEPAMRRAVAEELRAVVASLQNAEPKVPKAILDEIRALSANAKAQETRPQTPQASLVDQIKVLQASVEALKARLSEERGRGDSAASADIAQLRQLVATASDQFGKCQTQLASIGGPGSGAAVQQAATATAAAITVSQERKAEPAAVVFYDNVMLKKDQEKQYEEIGVKLSLQSIGPRQVRVAVNKQGFGLSFGERKVFRSQDVECEINLMETNLNEGQARVSISCKR